MTISLAPSTQAASPRLGRAATLARLALIGAILAAVAATSPTSAGGSPRIS
jgi:hypothetical protein